MEWVEFHRDTMKWIFVIIKIFNIPLYFTFMWGNYGGLPNSLVHTQVMWDCIMICYEAQVVIVMQPSPRNNIKIVEIYNKKVIHALKMNNIYKYQFSLR